MLNLMFPCENRLKNNILYSIIGNNRIIGINIFNKNQKILEQVKTNIAEEINGILNDIIKICQHSA